MENRIRVLRADEIECRVQQCTQKGVILLLYKDARCDMAVLDEAFTPFGWQRKHEQINGKEFCTVSIRSENGEWISKQDCGTESNTEKAKGETSDAFKRACTNWGIGRELYTRIFIFVKVATTRNANGKYELTDKYAKFTVSHINTDEKAKKILQLEISDERGNVVFKWDNKNPPPNYADIEDSSSNETEKNGESKPSGANGYVNTGSTPKNGKGITEKQVNRLHAIRKKAGLNEEPILRKIKEKYGKERIEDLNREEYDYICENLQKIADEKAAQKAAG